MFEGILIFFMFRHFFWNKLRSMVDNEGTTVFMTCSDEIDVKYADIVGYLRNGNETVGTIPKVIDARVIFQVK